MNQGIIMELTIYKADELIHAVPILKFAKLCNGLYAIQIEYEEALFNFINESEMRYSEDIDNIYDHIDEEFDIEEIRS